MAGRSKKLDPTTGEPVAPKPAEPRPLYLIYKRHDADNEVELVDDKGELNPDAFVFSTRVAKDALTEYSKDPKSLHFIQLMVK